MFAERGRTASTVSPLDFLGSLPDSRVTITKSNVDATHWYRAVGPGWEDLQQLQADVNATASEVTVTATDSQGNVQTTTVPFSDVNKVQRLYHDNEAMVIRLLGTRDTFFGTPSAATSTAPEGEARATGTPLAIEGEASVTEQRPMQLLSPPAAAFDASLPIEGEPAPAPATESIDAIFALDDSALPTSRTPHVTLPTTHATENSDFSAAVDLLLADGESPLAN